MPARTVKLTIPDGETTSEAFNAGEARRGVIGNNSGGALTLTLQTAVFAPHYKLETANQISSWATAVKEDGTTAALSAVAIADNGHKEVELWGGGFRLLAGGAVTGNTDVYIFLEDN